VPSQPNEDGVIDALCNKLAKPKTGGETCRQWEPREKETK
jgi:hypothetical protein